MAPAPTDGASGRKPLRLWPGVLLVTVQWVSWLVVPVLFTAPAAGFFGVGAGLLIGVLVLLWWVFLSRALWLERLLAVVVVVVAMAATRLFLHESVATGNVGIQQFIYAIPVVSLAFVLWAVVTRNLSDQIRRVSMIATVVVTCGVWAFVRSDGLTGDGAAQLAWRWSDTAEERLLARAGDDPVGATSVQTAVVTDDEPEWPGLRGPDRTGILPGVRIATDWSTSPPVELWRRPVGPGTSAIVVGGSLLYTHEQRGDDEVVTAYDRTTGEPVWRHRDTARFSDSYVGAGPRATPALGGGRVYTFGATGILNALDAATGAVVWSRDAAADAEVKVPFWGFCGSPLVLDDVLIVAVGGRLVAYELDSGEPRWLGPAGNGSYGSPQRLTIAGIPQIVLVRNSGPIAVDPADGTPLWEHAWPGIGIVQPVLAAEGDLLFSMINDGAMPIGTRRIAVTRGPEEWTTEERWTTTRLKPSFSSVVVHEGHAYGFDGRILACIDVANGERKWKGGRYGSGQLVLLPDQDLLLVLSEQGEVALVSATPERFTEIARFPAIEGKTWSQPTLVGDLLLVRNGEEMAAFRVSLVRG